jgi:GH43 family beta-xylosidase
VLECAEENPLTTNWDEKGQIKTLFESFSLDATTFEHKGMRYLIWAQKDDTPKSNSCLYLDEMINPWTLAGKQIKLSTPELDWEKIGFHVNEGPAVLKTENKIFVAYSASATDYNYCMGLLSMHKDDNPLEITSWKKSQTPVFTSSEENGQYGPGHNSFVHDASTNQVVMVYHARNYKEIDGDPLKDPNRHAKAQYVTINGDSIIFGEPVPNGPYEGLKELMQGV